MVLGIETLDNDIIYWQDRDEQAGNQNVSIEIWDKVEHQFV